MSAAVARRAVSPYARRLARERGIDLADLAGTGPNGRIVAADVQLRPAASKEAVAAPAPSAVPAPPAVPMAAPARSIGAFSASIELTALNELIEAAGGDVPLDAFLVKSAAKAAAGFADQVRYVAEAGGVASIPAASGLSPSGIARLFETGEADMGGRPIVVSRLRRSGIRPVAGGLPADADLRLLVVAARGAAIAEAMLVHDAAIIAEAEAAAMLEAFRDAIENPLRLLV